MPLLKMEKKFVLIVEQKCMNEEVKITECKYCGQMPEVGCIRLGRFHIFVIECSHCNLSIQSGDQADCINRWNAINI